MPASSATKGKTIGSIGPELLVGLGLGANGAWVGMSFKSLTLYGNVSAPGGSEPVLDAVYLISIVTVCITLAIAAVMERRIWMALAHFPTFLALAIGTAVTTVFMPMGTPAGSELHTDYLSANRCALRFLFQHVPHLFRIRRFSANPSRKSGVRGGLNHILISAIRCLQRA